MVTGPTFTYEVAEVLVTLAGQYEANFINGVGSAARFNQPAGIAISSIGDLYVADADNNCIRKVTPTGVVSTFAGTKLQGFADGVGTAASFSSPKGLAFDKNDNLYVADTYNNLIRKVTPQGLVSTIAGNRSANFADGVGAEASFNSPIGVAIDLNGNIFVVDRSNKRIRKISPENEVTTFAGNGSIGFDNGTGTAASFYSPAAITIDNTGNLFVADSYAGSIRKITPEAVVTTVIPTGASGILKFNNPQGITVDKKGNLYISDSANALIKLVKPDNTMTIYAGMSDQAPIPTDGIISKALLGFPIGLVTDADGKLYIVDLGDNSVREVTTE